MRLRISHLTSYRFEVPAASMIQVLRLTPRNHDGQYVADWRIDLSADCRLDHHEDAFGNITHAFTVDGPIGELSILAEGEVETRDTQGIVRGTIERFPPTFYLRETALSQADAAIAAFADAARAATGGNVLALLHRMLDRLHDEIDCETELAQPVPAAADAFAHRRTSPQGLAHIFVAAARSLGIPARYIGGYVHRAGSAGHQGARHAWSEAFVPELGWVAFDPANGICPTEAHVRVAVGLDELGAGPMRGQRYGGKGEACTMTIAVEQARHQSQT